MIVLWCKHIMPLIGVSVASLVTIVLFSSSPVMSTDGLSDELLTGYVAAILERNLHWEKDSYVLKIVNGVATITLFEDDPMRRKSADKELRTIDGLQEIAVVVKPADAGKPGAVSRFMRITGETELFPVGDLFQPLIADPKCPQFFASINRSSSLGVQYTMASVGFGETFGMYRFLGNRKGDGLQLSITGALFAQFNLDAPSMDLINADYIIGIPATYRLGDNSLRLRVYHQSSHLGDEFLMEANAPERVNLSYEAIELIYSREWHRWRVYGGSEYIVHREPDDLDPMIGHWGIEYCGSKPLLWNGRPIAGADMKSFEEHDWAINVSLKVGLEFGRPNPGQRRLRLIAEWYKGFNPRGQFYINKAEYYGIGMSLGF